MKNKASTFLRQAFTVIIAMVKAKTTALKSKAGAVKTRLLLFRLLHNKKNLMKAISHKLHALMGDQARELISDQSCKDDSKVIILYDAEKEEASPSIMSRIDSVEPDEDDGYPDLRHSLFDEEDADDELTNGTGSVIDLVRNSREDGSDFNLEDEIDRVADVFIRRFRMQMMMQKLESFKRYQEMLERGA